MPKVRTQINCPQCRQPITAEIEQIFDVTADPSAKQRLLSGQYNLAQCPHCGFHGNMATPLVYHDADKELLLSFVPPELNLPMEEQEKVVGKMINQVLESLPQEKRKGYLLNPQRVLTMQGLVERVLQEEGITKEMIEEQQKRGALIQRLITISDDEALAYVAKEEDEQIDGTFFAMISQLIEASLARGDQASAEKFSQLQQRLLPITTFGKQLKEQSEELEAAVKELRDLGEGLTREKLLELVLNAPSDARIDAYASVARSGMDYQFLQLLSDKIETAEGEEKTRLEDIRTRLLETTAKIDEELQARLQIAKQNLDALLSVDNLRDTLMANLGAIDEFFLQALNQEMAAASQENDKERLEKLQQVIDIITELSQAASGANPQLVQSLIDAEDEEARKVIMDENADDIDSRMIETLSGLLVQLEGPDNVEMADKVRKVYREAVRFSMQAQMKAGAEEKKAG